MTDVLSQDEIEKLLAAINGDNSERSQDSGTKDWPDKFSREQKRAISVIHEKFARMAIKNLSAKIRADVKIIVASVDQLPVKDFLRSIPSPSVLGIISMEPLNGSAVMEIDPSIASAVINRLCHGTIQSKKMGNGLTSIGKKIMETVFASLLENLRGAWSEITDLRPQLDKIETDPESVKLYPPEEGVVLVTLEVTLEAKTGDVQGMVNFAIPYPVIEPVAEKFSSQW
jgi:flagellar motor switch protein FliM